MKRARTAALLACLAGCGGSPPLPPAPPPPTPASSAAPTPELTKQEPPPSAEACAGPKQCANVGLQLKKRGEASAKVALGKACSAEARIVDACAALTTLHVQDATTPPATLAEVAEHGCSKNELEETSDKEARGLACVTAGGLYREGKGVPKDRDKAMKAFRDGCSLGAQRACEGERELVDEDQRKVADNASGVPGANLRVSSATTNGVTVEQIACKADGGAGLGLLGSLVLGKPFADKKRALDGCAKTPHKVRVRWVAKNGKMTEVKVISPADDPSNKCIERAMTGAVAPIPGTCAASVEVGRPKK